MTDRIGELYDAHAARLYAYARRHADAEEAEDLVAEAFSVAIRKVDDLPVAEEFAWLVGTVRKLAANHRRRRSTRDAHWQQAIREAWHTGVAASPEDAVAEREQCLAALAALSESDREALLLVAWEGLSPEQAAAVVGCTRQAFAVRLHRARRRLESALTAEPATLRAVALPSTQGEGL